MSACVSERLPGVIGHELRNPLASAVTGAMLAREMVDEQDPRAVVLDGVLRDLDRMTGLIDGWLQLASDRPSCNTTADVEQILQGVADRHRIEVVATPPSTRVQGNRLMLERVLENLCENARKAGATKIRVAAQQDSNSVRIHIEDNGRGIDESDIEHIFEPGWTGGGGKGLGLFAVSATLAACNGEVRCVPLAQGTRFTVTLARAEVTLA